ncbi:hypothetical protein [Streptomyces sp. NBC_01236]|uniref:hypothetical protein n=1 Tax=Streptomyces sp. NBC_01236 TaxID=2903789 RepID=UPI002E152E78|nr:hypothetical protein OG324_00845 [Streptomyces sp. NBC_01236]
MSTSPIARTLAAGCLVATGIAAVLSSGLTPNTSSSSGARIDAFAAHTGSVGAALTADIFVVLLGAATVLAALLAWRASPKLAGVAGWLGMISGSAMIFLVALDFATHAAVGVDRKAAGKLLDNITGTPQFVPFLVLGLLGGLVAMVCLGIALWRSRAVPRWAAVALIAYEPANVLTADAGSVPFAVANALLLAGFAACAVAVVRGGLPSLTADTPAYRPVAPAVKRAPAL